jgi:hypothetical protein
MGKVRKASDSEQNLNIKLPLRLGLRNDHSDFPTKILRALLSFGPRTLQLNLISLFIKAD